MEEGMKKALSVSASGRARENWRKLKLGVNDMNIDATTSGYRFSRPASAANISITSNELAVLHVNQVVVTSTGTSPETQYYSCTDTEQDNDNKGNPKVYWRRNSSIRSISMETNDFSSMDVQQRNAGNGNGSKRKVLEWIFAIANFTVEVLSVAFDQLSSQHVSVFQPVCMGMSILAVLICLCELVYKIRKEKATWKKKGVFSWFYHPSGVPFGSFEDVIGLACACGQCILTTINYYLFLKHGDVPIKVSIWPTIFAFGQLCSTMRKDFNCKRNARNE